MKTAQERFDALTLMSDTIHKGDVVNIMKEYATEVAEQALKDAAEKYNGITMKDDFGCICDVPSAITSTKIITP